MFTFDFRRQTGWKTTFWKLPLLNNICVIQLGQCHIYPYTPIYTFIIPIFTYIYPIYLYLPILTYIYPHFIPIYAPYNQIYTNRTIALFASASNSLAGWIHHRHLFLVNIKVQSLSFHVIHNPLYSPLPSVSPSLSPGWLWDASSVRNLLLQQLIW